MEFILASNSPRRREILSLCGAKFTVIPAQGEELITTAVPEEAVIWLAEQKADEVYRSLSSAALAPPPLILGADTVVAFQNQILGKPKDEAEAFSMLHMLSGQAHSVYTGVALIWTGRGGKQIHRFYQETKVVMYPITDQEIARYIKTGEPTDKAGAYGIQGLGALLIEKIDGDYHNVVGLPLAKLNQEMKKLGIEIFVDSYYDRKGSSF